MVDEKMEMDAEAKKLGIKPAETELTPEELEDFTLLSGSLADQAKADKLPETGKMLDNLAMRARAKLLALQNKPKNH